MIFTRLLIFLIAVCASCVTVALLIGTSLPRYELAFASTIDGDFEIYRLDIGRGLIGAVTHNEVNDWLPAWSPDGKQIAFVSERDGNREIYTMDAGGQNVRRMTDDPANDFDPAWSPDGTDIAFTTERFGYTEIMLVNSKNGITRRLTHNDTMDIHPAWSPDGKQLVVASDYDERWNQELYLITTEGDYTRRLTFNPGSDVMPAWSPDGRTIIYISTRSTVALVALNLETNKLSVLINSLGDAFNYPNWSPDSRHIAFDRDYARINLLDSNCLSQPETCSNHIDQLFGKPNAHLYTAPRWRP
ncbi:MAG: hypothetical protein K8L97_27015 [Anaerolineae bacterium]|nr:hypothetical protein [Anaerolineae bacterium]